VEAQTFSAAVPFYPLEWKVPPPLRRQTLLPDTESPSNPGLLLIGKDQLPNFTPDMRAVPPRPVFRRQLEEGAQTNWKLLWGAAVQLPLFVADLRIPPQRLFSRALLDWTGQPVGTPIPPVPPIVTVPSPPSGGIGMRRFDKKGRLRYPEAQESPFEGYTADQLRRMVEMELPRLDKAEWQEARKALETGTVSLKALDALPVGFDLMRARAIEVGAGLMLAELRAAQARKAVQDEEDELIAMLLLFS